MSDQYYGVFHHANESGSTGENTSHGDGVNDYIPGTDKGGEGVSDGYTGMEGNRNEKVNRRRFFKKGGLAASAVAAVSLLGGTAHAAQRGTLKPSGSASPKEDLQPMSWEGLNGSINAGETQYWNYSWGNSDHGAQCAMANPFGYNSQLISYDFGKNRTASSVTYYVTVRNNGPSPTTFDLQGGGLS
jgi:hypothetical protein